ncbi:MAG: hypothetical protein PHD03_00845 [Bacilli bacterium]|nr:hypothetical protein [Bacilli bacterium]MDD4406808.1 hypothetical protein [Bacilli bacterium]
MKDILRRYLNPKSADYKKEVNIINFFELLFDTKDLKNIYFTNNFISFIKNPNKYISTSGAINLTSKSELAFKLKITYNTNIYLLY